MRPDERLVAGLRCSQVLDDLSAYLDDELAPDRRMAIEAHVRACVLCATFGAEFAATLAAVRAQLSVPDPLPDQTAHNLSAALARDITTR